MDLYLGRHVRSLLEGLGLVQVGCEGTTSIVHGSEPSTLFQRAILPLLQPLYLRVRWRQLTCNCFSTCMPTQRSLILIVPVSMRGGVLASCRVVSR